jgi:putative ABC transport system permease protein
MTRLVLRGLLSRKLRTVLTAIAIVLGVAMVSGTFLLTDQIDAAFKDIFQTSNAKIDAVVSKRAAFGSERAAGPLPDSYIERVRRVDGVQTAAGQVEAQGANLVVDGKVVDAHGAPALMFSVLPPDLSPVQMVQGRQPQGTGEMSVIKKVADDENLRIGQRVGLNTLRGVQPFTVVGIYNFGDVSSIGGATVVSIPFEDAQRDFDRVGQTSLVLARADSGVSPEELVRRIQRVVPRSVLVQTGQQDADKQTSDIAGGINDFLRPALLAFGGVALLVGAFIIFNSFSITVAQRVREFGMLRTIGATRRQVLRGVIGEALVVGVVASVIGLFLGLGIAALIQALFNSVGFGLPSTGLELKPRTIIISLIVGIGVTLLAAIGPALRATRVPPVAALREGATLPRGRLSRLSPYLGGLLLVVGIVLLVWALFSNLGATQALQLLGLGALLIFIGAAMMAKYVVRPLARLIGWPIERIFKTPGRLARENTTRNPARTAATAAALMIGVGLVAFVAIFADGIKASFNDAIDKTVHGDLILTTSNFDAFPATSTAAIRNTEGVALVEPIRFAEVKVNRGGTEFLNTIDPANAPKVFEFDWRKGGSDKLFSELGTTGALVETNLAKDRDLTPGTRFAVTTQDGHRATFKVLGEYRDPILFTGFTVSNAAANRLDIDRSPVVSIVKLEPGADVTVVQRDLQATADQRFPTVEVQTNAEYKDRISSNLDSLLYLLYALLAISLVISLFGIVNTLVLSIYERTREIGMLRAIGTTRGQLRRVIRYESVITAVIGGILGIAIGVLFGWIISRGLSDQGIKFSIPWLTLVIFLVLAVIAGVLAATFPARRAARLNILDALHYE